MSSELARIAGPVGAAGLVVLLLAPTRTYRLAGLVAWAAGLGALAVYLKPGGHAALLGAAAVAGLVLAGVGAALLVRWPWLLALAVLACVPARIPVSVGSTDANLLVPLYGVVAAAALALAWGLLKGDDRSRELGPVALPASRVRRLERPLARLGHRRPPGLDRAALLLPPVRAAGRLALAPGLAAQLGARPLRRADRDGPRVRARRHRAVDQPRHLLEPEAARRQHVRAVLPRQLGLLGPVDLRALPRRCDPGEPGRRALLTLAAGRDRRADRDRRDVDRAALLVLAVELHRADRRARRGHRATRGAGAR